MEGRTTAGRKVNVTVGHPKKSGPSVDSRGRGQLASARSDQDTEAALRERVKELTCLYGIAQLAGEPEVPLGRLLQGVADLLPPAWQYPKITSGRIEVDGQDHATKSHGSPVARQEAEIVVAGRPRGFVEVVYSEEKPELDEGPFLKEERALIGAIAQQVALIIERREAGEERLRIREQLQHADRLATIGQLAAGVAHELNEPLGGILGLAQLAVRPKDVPPRTKDDIDKIKAICLQAREIIKKLLVFARQAPPEKARTDLNQMIEGGLDFFEARRAQQGVDLVLELAPGLPEITCDPAQINQVLVNLIVNALQAMPGGGKLTVRTEAGENDVRLLVQDTGIGMSREVLDKVFVPFFTTKEVGEGTGLGLPVVHGIVDSHKGSISVESRPGRGTRVEVRLPLTGAGNNDGSG